jgi:hypothetical protein
MTVTAKHIRRARRLLGWSQVALAVRSGVGALTSQKNSRVGWPRRAAPRLHGVRMPVCAGRRLPMVASTS